MAFRPSRCVDGWRSHHYLGWHHSRRSELRWLNQLWIDWASSGRPLAVRTGRSSRYIRAQYCAYPCCSVCCNSTYGKLWQDQLSLLCFALLCCAENKNRSGALREIRFLRNLPTSQRGRHVSLLRLRLTLELCRYNDRARSLRLSFLFPQPSALSCCLAFRSRACGLQHSVQSHASRFSMNIPRSPQDPG